jgi:hypothetical protein
MAEPQLQNCKRCHWGGPDDRRRIIWICAGCRKHRDDLRKKVEREAAHLEQLLRPKTPEPDEIKCARCQITLKKELFPMSCHKYRLKTCLGCRETRRKATTAENLVLVRVRGWGRRALAHLGCTIPEYVKYLESHFQPGMTWDNNSPNGWHIDHLTPLLYQNHTKSSRGGCDPRRYHFTNTAPMWAEDNRDKNNGWADNPKLSDADIDEIMSVFEGLEA